MATAPLGPVNPTNRLPAPEANPFSLKRYSAGTRKIASFGLSLFIIGLIIASLWAPRYWALSTLCSGAWTALGWGVGFLFGVPRTSSTDTQSNTNLEQISDWLTKVLVGVGLTQLQKIPVKLQLLAEYISKDYGNSGSSVFALSMVLYFSALGFLTGYLLTRLALQPEFEGSSNKPTEPAGKDKDGVEVKAGAAEMKVVRANVLSVEQNKITGQVDGMGTAEPAELKAEKPPDVTAEEMTSVEAKADANAT